MKKLLLVLLMSFSITIVYSNLIISEVYFDGRTNEYVGIYNKSDKLFSGQIALSGIKSSILKLNLSINPFEEILIGDNIYFTGVKCLTGQGLSISDTKAINIKLFSGEKLEDTFSVSEEKVKLSDKNHWGFEKVLYSTLNEILTGSSPGKVKDYTIDSGGNIFSSGDTYQISCSIVLSGNKLYYESNYSPTKIIWNLSGNVFTGKTLDLDLVSKLAVAEGVFSGASCQTMFVKKTIIKNIFLTPLSDYFYISEIYAKSGNYPEYIELTFKKSFSGELSFIGLGRGDSKWSTFVKANTGDIVVISKEKIFSGNNIVYSSMSLADKGETIKIFSGNDLNLIKIDYPSFKTSISYYPKYEKFSYPTPGSIYQNYYCKVVFQSFKDNKINLMANVSNFSICKAPYIPTWIVGDKIYTGTCNPSYFKISENLTGIKFQILGKNKNIVCEDTFHFFKFKTSDNKELCKVDEYTCSSLNSYQLKNLNSLIKQRYALSTLKRIYSPISFIYLSGFYKKLNSRQIRQVVENSVSRYSLSTLKFIYNPIKFLYTQDYPITGLYLEDIKVFSGYNQVVFTGSFSTGFYLALGRKKIYIKDFAFSGDKLIFKFKKYLPKRGICFKVKFKEKIYDEKCFLNGKLVLVDKFYFLKNLNSTKYSLVFSGKNILLYADGKLIGTYKNKPLVKLYKLALKLFRQLQKDIKKKNKSIRKLNILYISYLKKYVYYKGKYDKLKQTTSYTINLKKQQIRLIKAKLKKYKSEIKILKYQIRQIKKFIRQNVSYSVYKKLLNFIKLNGK